MQNMLSDDELIHYSRHIILPQIDEVGQEKLKQASVLIVGLGGLGSPVAMYLAAAGVGHLYLADHDTVERSNLQRQIIHSLDDIGKSKLESATDSLSSLNPWVKTTLISDGLNEKNINNYINNVSLVIDCSDNFKTRFLINEACANYNKPLVSGAAIRFEGQLAVFNLKPTSACYQCLYDPATEVDENCSDRGILSPVVGTIGTLQATEAIKILTGAGKVCDSELVIYDALHLSFKKIRIKKDLDCKICEK